MALDKKKSKNLSTGGAAANVVKSVREVHFESLLCLLRHKSGVYERTICVALAREEPSRPNLCKPLLHLSPFHEGVHVHLSHVLDLHLRCLLAQVGWE